MTKDLSGLLPEDLRVVQSATRGQDFWRSVTPYLFLLPALVPVFGLLLYPLVYVFQLSLREHVLYRPYEHGFIGLKNFVELLQDVHFWQSLNASLIWVVGSIVPQFVFGLILALLLNQQFRGRGLYRAIVISPWAIGGVLTGIFWTWLFNSQVGPINDLLLKSGIISERIPWKVTAFTAFFSVLVANVWRGIPFFAIMMLAALQSIPDELYEAATVDGAGTWQRFRFITLPLIKNQAVLSTMLRSIWVFGNIDLIWTMTEGAPAGATRTLAVYVLHTAYKFSDFGYGAAVAVVIFLISLIFAITYLRVGHFTQELEAEAQG
jgi:multiple sugar transport system permease protein